MTSDAVAASLVDGQPDSGMMPGMTPPRHAPPKPWTVPQALLAALTAVTAVGLAPLFFADMFTTVVHLLAPSFGWWAWTVPVATEASFVIFYALDLLLELRGKPMGWLRWAPYPFAVASLALNVAASGGSRPAMVGHAAVTAAFFGPLLAAKAAVRSLSASDDEVAQRRAMADARRYAIDLLRAELGWRWRLSAPRLMRRQVVTGRLPHTVTTAVRESLAAYGEPWEPTVERWVVDGLTQAVKMAARVEAQKRVIEASAQPSEPVATDTPPARQPARQSGGPSRAQKQAKVRRLLTDGKQRTTADVARLAGVSESTVDRVKRDIKPRVA